MQSLDIGPEHDQERKVDVVIGVYGKPYHSAVTIASLLKWSGQHIGRIFIQKEKKQPHGADVDALEDVFSDDRFFFYTPEIHVGIRFSSDSELAREDYRRSLRYQRAWEDSSSDFLFIAHNDCLFTGDIIGQMLSRSENGEISGIGLIGQCWNCPAKKADLCSHERFMDYRPNYEEAVSIARRYPGPRTPPESIKRESPMPFPECRLNEFSCLVNLKKAKPETMPMGPVPPFGLMTNDIGTEWFRQLVLRGHRFKNWFESVSHAPFSEVANGFSADLNVDIYQSSEDQAARYLQDHFPEIFYELHHHLDRRRLARQKEKEKEKFLSQRPYAVMFKAHFWNDFVQRQFDRLIRGAASADVYVLLIGNADACCEIHHDADKIIRITDADCAMMGFVSGFGHPFFWYSKDYPALYFFSKNADYAYYAMIEYDAASTLALDDLVWEASRIGADYLGEPGPQALEQWVWSRSCDGVYRRDEILNWTSYFCIFSNAALNYLLSARRDESSRFLKGEFKTIPFSEAAIPTLLNRAGMVLARLREFGLTGTLTWDKAVSEDDVDQYEGSAFFHPVAPGV